MWYTEVIFLSLGSVLQESHIVSGGSVLIFVTKKLNSEELAKNLKEKDYECELISLEKSKSFEI